MTRFCHTYWLHLGHSSGPAYSSLSVCQVSQCSSLGTAGNLIRHRDDTGIDFIRHLRVFTSASITSKIAPEFFEATHILRIRKGFRVNRCKQTMSFSAWLCLPSKSPPRSDSLQLARGLVSCYELRLHVSGSRREQSLRPLFPSAMVSLHSLSRIF